MFHTVLFPFLQHINFFKVQEVCVLTRLQQFSVKDTNICGAITMTYHNTAPIICDACVHMYPVEKCSGDFIKPVHKLRLNSHRLIQEKNLV